MCMHKIFSFFFLSTLPCLLQPWTFIILTFNLYSGKDEKMSFKGTALTWRTLVKMLRSKKNLDKSVYHNCYRVWQEKLMFSEKRCWFLLLIFCSCLAWWLGTERRQGREWLRVSVRCAEETEQVTVHLSHRNQSTSQGSISWTHLPTPPQSWANFQKCSLKIFWFHPWMFLFFAFFRT